MTTCTQSSPFLVVISCVSSILKILAMAGLFSAAAPSMTSHTLKCDLKLLISMTTLSLSPPSFLTQSYFWTWPSFSLSSKKKAFDFSRVWDHDGEVGTIHSSVCKNAFCSPYIISLSLISPQSTCFNYLTDHPYLYLSSPLAWEASQHKNLRKPSTSWKLIQQMFLLCSKLPWCEWF